MDKQEQEAREVIGEALRFLNSLQKFESHGRHGIVVWYEAPDVIETFYHACGGSSILLRAEGNTIRVKNPNDNFVDGNGNPAEDLGSDSQFLAFWWSLFDPRKILPHFKESKLYLSAHQDGGKACFGRLALEALNPPKEFLDYLQDEGGTLEPEVELFFDENNRLTHITRNPILPGEDNVLTLEFRY